MNIFFTSILTITLSAHQSITAFEQEKELLEMQRSAINFLNVFDEEEYVILETQYLTFNNYEKLLSAICEVPIDIEQGIALCFAQALSKGANIYRRIACQASLQLAVQYHQKALEMRKKHLSSDAIQLAHSFVDLGATHNELKGIENNKKAIEYYEKGLEIYKKNSSFDSQQFIASTLHKLGNALRDLDKKNINLAIDYLDQALLIFEQLPDNNFIRIEKGKILYNQGMNYHLLGGEVNDEKAIEYLGRAKIVFEQNNDKARLAKTLSYLGAVFLESGNGNIVVVIDYLNEALEIQGNLFNGEHVDIAVSLQRLGSAYCALQGKENLSIAIAYLKKAVDMQKKLLPEDHPALLKTLSILDKCNLKIEHL